MEINMLNPGDIVESIDHYFGIVIDRKMKIDFQKFDCQIKLKIKWHDGQINEENEEIFERLVVKNKSKLHKAKLKLNGNYHED